MDTSRLAHDNNHGLFSFTSVSFLFVYFVLFYIPFCLLIFPPFFKNITRTISPQLLKNDVHWETPILKHSKRTGLEVSSDAILRGVGHATGAEKAVILVHVPRGSATPCDRQRFSENADVGDVLLIYPHDTAKPECVVHPKRETNYCLRPSSFFTSHPKLVDIPVFHI